MTVYHNAREVESAELRAGDRIVFQNKKGDEAVGIVRKVLGYYLEYEDHFWNYKLLEFVGVSDAKKYEWIKSIIGYTPEEGDFPEVRTLEDLKKVIIAMYNKLNPRKKSLLEVWEEIKNK